MKVTPEMKIKEALDSNEQMVDAFRRISPQIRQNDPDYRPVDSSRPRELWGLRDDDQHVIFVDAILRVQRNENPWPAIMHGLTELRDYEDVLLLRHTFNPFLYARNSRSMVSQAGPRSAGQVSGTSTSTDPPPLLERSLNRRWLLPLVVVGQWPPDLSRAIASY